MGRRSGGLDGKKATRPRSAGDRVDANGPESGGRRRVSGKRRASRPEGERGPSDPGRDASRPTDRRDPPGPVLNHVESGQLLRRITEIRRVMSAQTRSGDRLAEWAQLVDEDVPEELREERSADG